MKNSLILLFLFFWVNTLAAQNLMPEQDKKGLFGYKKENSKRWSIKPTFQDAKKFGEMGLDSTLAFAKQNNLWGVIDQKGKWTLEPRYDSVAKEKLFTVELPLIYENYLKNFLNKKGNKQTIPFTYFNTNFRNADTEEPMFLMLISEGLEYLYVINGTQILPTNLKECEYIIHLSHSAFLFQKNGKKGVFQFGENEKVLNNYDELTPFRRFLIGQKGRKFERIDIKTLDKKDLGELDGLQIDKNLEKVNQIFFVPIKNNKIGLLNYDAEIILDTEYDDYEYYDKTIYQIRKNYKYGLVDLETKQIILETGKNIYIKKAEECLNLSNEQFCLVHNGQKVQIFDIKKRQFWTNFDNISCQKIAYDKSVTIVEKNGKMALFKGYSTMSKNKKAEELYYISDFYDKIITMPNHIYAYKGKKKYSIDPDTFDSYNATTFSNTEKEVEREDFDFKEVERADNETNLSSYASFELVKDARYEGGIDAFKKEIQKNLIYSEKSKIQKVQGNLVIDIIIDENGYISLIQSNVYNNIGGDCAQEVLKALAKTKKWEAGKNFKGDFVKVRKMISVTFKL